MAQPEFAAAIGNYVDREAQGVAGYMQQIEARTPFRRGERQVPDADVGLTHNVGGIGQYCFVNVFRRD